MPGPYAHITAVNIAKSRVHEIGISEASAAPLLYWLGALELGSVSPDYPYLSLRGPSVKWADLMHYARTATFLRNGVKAVREMKGVRQEKAIAWLFGLCAHFVMDTTIHPVIERKVGPYKHNKAHHRLCEMHQDVYVFPRLDLGDVGRTDHLRFGIAVLSDANGDLDEAISQAWFSSLCLTHPKQAERSPPRPREWHRAFLRLLGGISAANHHFAFGRHVAARHSLNYPMDVNAEFVVDLPTPEGPMSYDLIFDRAITNILDTWLILDAALQGNDNKISEIRNWNLDTGLISGTKELVFWRPQ